MACCDGESKSREGHPRPETGNPAVCGFCRHPSVRGVGYLLKATSVRALQAISALQAKHTRKTDFLSMAKKGQTRPAMVKSAIRILRIFEVFAESKRPVRISELAEELEIPQSSASVLART